MISKLLDRFKHRREAEKAELEKLREKKHEDKQRTPRANKSA